MVIARRGQYSTNVLLRSKGEWRSRVSTLCYVYMLRRVIGMDGQDRQDTDGIFTLSLTLSHRGGGSEIATLRSQRQINLVDAPLSP